MPLILLIVLSITMGRGLAVLGPAFKSVRERPSGISSPAFLAPQAELSIRPDARLSPLFTPEVQRWASHIQRWSVEYAIPADLIAVVMQIESCGDPRVVSPSGAIGLFQVMPYHFTPEEDPFDVESNARQGLAYLSGSLSLAANDPSVALAGYNGGHGVIGLPDSQWAGETVRYVNWGAGILRDARAGLMASPGLSAWLESGGRSLCQRAALSTGVTPLQDR
jgi:soluble lytic murein transglycosylase-like protein